MWYYKDEEKEVGPLSTEELKQLAKDKKINGRTLVRNAKGSDWIALAKRAKKKVQEPKEPQKAPEPSLPPKQTSEVIIPDPAPFKKPPKPRERKKRQKLPFSFTGVGSEYFKIWIVNIVLTVLTFGIYSAWAKVRKKQYFYGNTRVNDASFNYLANPVTILKGRIIVFIGFIIYSVLEALYPGAGAILILTMLPLLPFFVVRALSFNARNSATRNIRFTFSGTYMEAAKVYLFWPILIPLTLGFIAPYIYFKQKKFIVENSGYGTTKFSFIAQPGDYYRIFLKLILPAIIVGIIGAVVNYFINYSSILFMAVFYLYAIAYFSVKATNLFYNSSRLADHSFQSTMSVKEFLGIFVTNTLATVLTGGLFLPFAEIRSHKYQIEHLTFKAVGDLNQFVADEKSQVSALGDEAAEFLDLDIGI